MNNSFHGFGARIQEFNWTKLREWPVFITQGGSSFPRNISTYSSTTIDATIRQIRRKQLLIADSTCSCLQVIYCQSGRLLKLPRSLQQLARTVNSWSRPSYSLQPSFSREPSSSVCSRRCHLLRPYTDFNRPINPHPSNTRCSRISRIRVCFQLVFTTALIV
jgi:hypothetical protein